MTDQLASNDTAETAARAPTAGLGPLLERVGRGQPLSANGAVSLLPEPGGAVVAAVLGVTAHHLIAADVDPDWLIARLATAGIGRPMQPDFLAALGRRLNAGAGGQDVLLVTDGTGKQDGGDPGALTANPAAPGHPRVNRALRYRDEVRVATVSGGLLTIGRGLAGRWEISIEVDEARRGAGIGRRLAGHGRGLIPPDDLLWAQVHPANAASLRAFLAAGYRPVGAEVLFSRESHAAPP